MKAFSTNVALAAMAIVGIMLLGSIPVTNDVAAVEPVTVIAPAQSPDGPALTAPPLGGADVPTWPIGYSWSSIKQTYKANWELTGGVYYNRSASRPEWSKQVMDFTFTVAGIEEVEINGKNMRVYNCTAAGTGTGYVKTQMSGFEVTANIVVASGHGSGYRYYSVEDLSLVQERLEYDGQMRLVISICTWDYPQAYTWQKDRFCYTNGSNPLEMYDFPLVVGETHDLDVRKTLWATNKQYRGDGSGFLCGMAGEFATSYSHVVDDHYWSNYTVAVQAWESHTVGALTWDCYKIHAADGTCPAGSEYVTTWYSPTYGAPLEERGAIWYDTHTHVDGDTDPYFVYYKWREYIKSQPISPVQSEVITATVTPSVAEAGSYVYVTGDVKIGGNPAGADLRAEVYNSPMKTDVTANPTTGLYNATIAIPLTNIGDNTTTAFDIGSHGIEVWDKANSPPSTWYHDIATLTVIPRQAPVADASASPLTVGIGESVDFSGALSTDNDRIVSYSWNFGDTLTGSGKTTSHSFSSANTYTVTLTVTDASGLTAQDTVQVTVTGVANVPPTANAGVDQTGTANFLCTFNGAGSSDSDGSIASYSWAFTYNSSPQTLAGVGPSFNFQIPGVYTVTLTVTDDDGATDTDTMTVTVNANPPTANAGVDQTGTANYLATFNGAGSSDPDGTIASYSWAFTYDGGPITIPENPTTFNFQIPGVYTVTLTVTDDDGATDTDTMIVTVNWLTANVAYASGWNLMSFPVNTEGGKPLETFLANEMANIRTVMAWDADNGRWLIWDSSNPDWMNTLDTIDEKHGYWVRFAAAGDGQLTVQGKMLTVTTIQLYAGWNLVSVPDNSNVAANTALAGTGFDLLMKFSSPATYKIATMAGTENMVPGSAYWVHVPADMSYTVTY